ncbi:MAG: type II toxin-antitoxin system RelE/ParE family toxin [Acetobacteraceae bacterium]|nr:type II toxin-antitoxin system RelE/ParE family toxin [Acetobacteraceae bacterium]
MGSPLLKPLVWIASSKRDLLAMPDGVRDTFGYALHLAQAGTKHEQAKPLKGQGSAGVLEVVENWKGDTYRAVYTVRFATAVYVLHCFQKKATKGIATPNTNRRRHRLSCLRHGRPLCRPSVAADCLTDGRHGGRP